MIKRCLVVRCGALGDLVYSTSVIDALKFEFGEDTIIDFLVTPSTASLFKKDKRVNRVFKLKHKKVPIFLSSQKKEVIKYSKENPYDLLINFEFGKQFKSLVYAIEAKQKVGAIFENIVFPKEVLHAVEQIKYMYKDIVSDDAYNKSFPRLIGSTEEEVFEKFGLDSDYIIVSPSNSHQKRNIINYRAWEDEKWRELIEKLSSNKKVVIIGAKNEESFFEKLMPYPSSVIDLVGKTDIPDLIGVVDGAKALISTDTGTAHIASAVDTEVFALIGPTPANVTGPYKTPKNRVNIISSNKECSPCYKTEVMKRCRDNICMKDITVDMVYEKIIKKD